MSSSLAIQINALQFRWRRNLPEVLNIREMNVTCGERIFIHGPSGSGKSTLLSLLAGVNLPTAGEVQVLGRSLGTLSGPQRDHFRSNHIGFIFQLFNLIPYLSVLENVTLPCRFSRLRKNKVLNSNATLEDEALRLLKHLDMANEELIHRPITELSVGQQQRVATARALIGAPEIIIADEPTSALDSDMRQAFLQLLFQECEATRSTLLFVSHDRQLEPLFEHQIALDEINQSRRDEH